jgi:hypothetical protein
MVGKYTIFATVGACVAVGWLATKPRLLSGLYNGISASITTWYRNEVTKGVVDAQIAQVKNKVSKRAWKRLEQLNAVELSTVFGEEYSPDALIPLAYKYSRQVRTLMCAPKYSAANEKCAYHACRKAMESDGVKPHHVHKAIHMAVQLVFVKDKYEIEARNMASVLDAAIETGH